jgi:hypothetical protein
LSSFKTALTEALDVLFYHDFRYQISDDRSRRFYALKIFSYNSVGLTFPNAEFKLVINPALIPGGGLSSSFPVNFSYEHDILRYLDLEDITNFSQSFGEYFNLFLSIAGLSKQLLMEELINTLIGGADISRSVSRTAKATLSIMIEILAYNKAPQCNYCATGCNKVTYRVVVLSFFLVLMQPKLSRTSVAQLPFFCCKVIIKAPIPQSLVE